MMQLRHHTVASSMTVHNPDHLLRRFLQVGKKPPRSAMRDIMQPAVAATLKDAVTVFISVCLLGIPQQGGNVQVIVNPYSQ